jgi:hypothetical protein
MKLRIFACLALIAVAIAIATSSARAQVAPTSPISEPLPTIAPAPVPTATATSGADAAVTNIYNNATKALATPCSGTGNVFSEFIDDIYFIFTFQTGGVGSSAKTAAGSGIAGVAQNAQYLAISIFMVAFGIGLLQLGRQLMKADLNTMIIAMTSRMITLVMGVLAINIAGGWYLNSSGTVGQAAPFTSQANTAGAYLAQKLFGPVLQAAQNDVIPGTTPVTIVPPTTPGTEVAYGVCVTTKLASYSFIQGFNPGGNANVGTSGGVAAWILGGTLDLLGSLVMAILYSILTLPAELSILASSLFMANHFFVLGINSNLLGVVAIFTLGFLGHEATRQWGKPFLALCYSIFTTSLALQLVNIVIASGTALIEAQIQSTTVNIQDIAFRSLAMGAFTLSLAIRGPKLAAIFQGAMGFDTADAIEGLAATAGLTAIAGKMIGAGLKAAANGIRGAAGRSVGGGSSDSKETSSKRNDAPTPAAPDPTGRPAPEPATGRPGKKLGGLADAAAAAAAAAAKGMGENKESTSESNRRSTSSPANAANAKKAADTLRKRAAAAAGATSDQKKQTNTASALTSFASNLENQSEAAQAAGDEKFAARTGALANAAKELATHAASIDPETLAESANSLATAAEQVAIVPPTSALQHVAATLSSVASPAAKEAARQIDAAAAKADGSYNAGSTLASATSSPANAANAKKAADTLRKRAAAAAGATSDQKKQTNTASALTSFASNLENQSEAAQAAGDEKFAARTGALANAAKELATHAASIDPETLAESANSLATAAEQVAIVPPTSALQHVAATLSSVASPAAKEAARQIDAAAAKADGSYNAGSTLASAAKANALAPTDDARNAQGSSLTKAIANARNSAATKASDTTAAGKAAAGITKTLDALGNATTFNTNAASALGAVGNTLSAIVSAHATPVGASTALNAASTQFGAAAADPKIDGPTRMAYLQAADAAGEAAAAISSTPEPVSPTTAVPIGFPNSASPITQSFATATNDGQVAINAAAAANVWQSHAELEARNGSPARAEAATRLSAAMSAIGRIGAPRNHLERNAYALIYSANHMLENGTASPGEVSGILANSETLLRASAQQVDQSTPRALHLNTAARALGATSTSVASLANDTPPPAAAPTSQPTTAPTSFPGNTNQPGPSSPTAAQRRDQRKSSVTSGLSATFYRAIRHHSQTNHVTHQPPQF